MRSARRALASNSLSRAGSVVSLMLLVRLCRSQNPNHWGILCLQVKQWKEVPTVRCVSSDHHIVYHSECNRHAMAQSNAVRCKAIACQSLQVNT